MTDEKYEIIVDNVTDTGQAPKGKGVYYRCTLCNDVIPSSPKDNIECKCANIVIDIDYFRLHVRDFSYFQVVRKIQKS